MRLKFMVACTVTTILALTWAIPSLSSQETRSPAPPAKSKSPSAYRLDFSLSEWEDGKKINTRQYSLNVVPTSNPAMGGNELKIGSRIPIEAKQGEMEYIDIGTNISARLDDLGESFQLGVRADLSSLANSPQDTHGSMPIVRQLRISASTLIVPAQPTSLGKVDDPNSKRQFQLDVVATKLK